MTQHSVKRSPRAAALLAAAWALAGPDAAATQGGFSLAPSVVEAADANHDGDVSSAEWSAFTAPAVAAGGSLREELEPRVLAAWLDVDGDAGGTAADVTRILGLYDVDGNGAIEAAERSGRAPGARLGELPYRATMAIGVLLEAADVDADGTLQTQEREGLVAAATGSLDELLRASIARVAETGAGDRSALTPAVILLTLGAALDADRNRNVDRADLDRLFADLDADGNGVVSASELNAGPPAAPSRSEEQADAKGQAPLMPWQRNLEDALALVASTGKPLLICVNMDGESASESLANRRYRDPEFVELASRFVPIIVSPDRHSVFEHDDAGRRLADPRFGRVIDSEHIDIEPTVFERYFAGTRVAPRHVGVAPDGEVLFDLYLLGSLSQIDEALADFGLEVEPADASEAPSEGAEASEGAASPPVRGGRGRGRRSRTASLLESPDAADRDRLEDEYADGDWRRRFDLASQALASERKTQHPELLRLALRDADERVRRQAVWTASRELERVPADLVPELLRVAAEDPVQLGVIEASFARLAKDAKTPGLAARAAATLISLRGASARSSLVDTARWRAALGGSAQASDPAGRFDSVEACVDRLEQLAAESTQRPDDPALPLERIDVLVDLAHLQLAEGRDPSIALEEARALAESAIEDGREDERTSALAAWTSYQTGDQEAAIRHLERAVPRLLAAGAVAGRAAADALNVLAQVRLRVGPGEQDASAWIADVLATYQVLLVHPLGTEAQALALLQFQEAHGLQHLQASSLRIALEGHPASASLHAWLRGQIARDHGAAALSQAYDSWLATDGRGGGLERASALWFAGLANLVAGDRHAAMGQRDAALETYARCEPLFLGAAKSNPEFEDSSMHYLCLARAGSARLQLEAGLLSEAAKTMRAALDARPASADLATSSGRTPNQIARRIAGSLTLAGQAEEAQALRDMLQSVPGAERDTTGPPPGAGG